MVKARGSGSRRRPEPPFLEVARVLRPWGVRGEVKVELLTSNPQDLAPGQLVYVGDETAPHQVLTAHAQGDAWIVRLTGYDSPERAEVLRDHVLRIRRANAAPLKPNQYYRRQIIGLAVVTVEGDELGHVSDILETGANDVYVVEGPRGEILLTARAEVIRQVDLDAGCLRVVILPGLLPE